MCFIIIVAGIGTSSSSASSDEDEKLDPNSMPYFDYSVSRNITTVVGQHAFLLCRVHRMKDQGVSNEMKSSS